jgi:hypothetical protein
MLTLAGFVLEKFGGDTVDDVRAALDHYRARTAATPEAPVAGGRVTSPAGERAATAASAHGLTGTDEAGSGGDD